MKLIIKKKSLGIYDIKQRFNVFFVNHLTNKDYVKYFWLIDQKQKTE